MKRTAAAILAASIVLIPATVKTRAAGRKADPKKDAARIVDFMMKRGLDGKIDENLARVMGLPGPRPMKGQNIRNKTSGKDRDALNCAVVYEETDDASSPGAKKPIYLYLMKVTESPRVKDSQFFRVNLDGVLEKVVTHRIKKDSDGKIIPGSGVPLEDDLDSSAVRKTFAAEMRAVMAWLKAQQTPAAKAAP